MKKVNKSRGMGTTEFWTNPYTEEELEQFRKISNKMYRDYIIEREFMKIIRSDFSIPDIIFTSTPPRDLKSFYFKYLEKKDG